jgi:DNA-binding transcriptional regulator GbsR (MarR family)
MTLEKIKREFVEYMETVRAGDPYPRSFIGCLMSILIEPEETSQERIMELTGYSQATVSLTLQKVQLLMPVRTSKRRGDRKRYYTYNGSPADFILDLWQKRLEMQGIDIDQIEMMIQKVKAFGKTDESAAIRRFSDYLNNMQLYLSLIHSFRASSIKLYEGVAETGSVEDLDYQEKGTLEKPLIEEFLLELRSKPMSSKLDNEPLKEYLILKNDYFSGMKANLNPLYSQTIANQMMVLHDVFIEGLTTQKMIEESTLLPRSTISELLTQFVKFGVIEVTKKEGSRIKLYRPLISFTDLMLSFSERLLKQAVAGKSQLSKYISVSGKIRPVSKETKKFLTVLNSFVKAYSFTHRFTLSFKAKIVTRLKEEYDRGFTFI